MKQNTTLNVNDVLDVLSQLGFPVQQQVTLLEILNFALYQKLYPEDICGIIGHRIQVLKEAMHDTALAPSNVQLSTKQGFKINFIRVINCLCELSFFTDIAGNAITKKEVFKTLGSVLNQDLSAFQNYLSSTKAAANSDMKSTLSIFERLHAKQQEINDK